jgi:hypothetical protein
MKKNIDTKKLLFENMRKLNSDFKQKENLLENKKEIITEDEKWIQKAVNPEHKGFCSPESKPTCTPARKALAKRFKKGIDEEYTESAPEELKNMAEKIKIAIDDLVLNEDEFGIIRTLYKLLIERKKASGISQPAVTSEVAEVKKPKIS